jgi:hypothetical protein
MNTLIAFIDNSNCVCKHCLKSDSVIQTKTIGVATIFTHRCSCDKMAQIKPGVLSINDEIMAEQWNDKPLKTESYDINQWLILALQQMGGGQMEAALLGGMLNIGTPTLCDQFQRIELEICKVEKVWGSKYWTKIEKRK